MKKLSLEQRIALLIAYIVEHAKDPTSVGTMRALRSLQGEYMVDLYLASSLGSIVYANENTKQHASNCDCNACWSRTTKES